MIRTFVSIIILLSGSAAAQDQQAKEVVALFAERVTQDLQATEQDILISDWPRHRDLIVTQLWTGNANTRRLCAQVLEAAKDPATERDLVAAYSVEKEVEVKVRIIYAMMSTSTSERVVDFAKSSFSHEADIEIKVALCSFVASRSAENEYWNYLLEGLRVSDKVLDTSTIRRPAIYRIRDTCSGLVRIGKKSDIALPLLKELATREKIGVITRHEVEYAIKSIEYQLGDSNKTPP